MAILFSQQATYAVFSAGSPRIERAATWMASIILL
jgi:hypothetical protein